jgi:hypothetical protein
LLDYRRAMFYNGVMEGAFICQGQPVGPTDLDWLRHSIAARPAWSRKRLARELCQRWQWRTSQGRWKDFAARSLLLKLEARGLLRLPPVRTQYRTRGWLLAPKAAGVEPAVVPRPGSLAELEPLRCLLPLPGSLEESRFEAHLCRHHYLGLRVVGENLKYLVQARDGTDLACLLFGAAAWKLKARDQFIGWSAAQRVAGLAQVANNTRFLILPWVKVPHLASHVLGQTVRRLKEDWLAKYGHPVWLVETFVDRQGFAGTAYRAANWRWVGTTQGRGRQGPDPRVQTVSVKEVFVYPLHRDFRGRLQRPTACGAQEEVA